MLRNQKEFSKFKCLERYCGKIIRQRKWSAHCKSEHGFEFILLIIDIGKGMKNLKAHHQWHVQPTIQITTLLFYITIDFSLMNVAVSLTMEISNTNVFIIAYTK